MAQEEAFTTNHDAAASLSDYERTRATNIERNNARLRELGLITVREERESNDLAWKRSSLSSFAKKEGEDDDNDGKEQGVPKKKRKRAPAKQPPTEPTRESRRVQGQDPEGTPVLERQVDNDDSTLEEIRQQQVQECRRARQFVALRYSQLTDAEKKAAKENPTATYEHCLKRVRTMTDKALYNRVKAIERATGKHCVIKMVRSNASLSYDGTLFVPLQTLSHLYLGSFGDEWQAIFKSCLQDEGMWELASAASEALERLKALKPPSE